MDTFFKITRLLKVHVRIILLIYFGVTKVLEILCIAELYIAFLLAIYFAFDNDLTYLWMENDSISALSYLKNDYYDPPWQLCFL